MSPRNRATPAIDKAEAYIRSLLSRTVAVDGCLPPIRSMAAEAGVSLVTMWKAVRRLRAAGTVHTTRSRVSAGGASADTCRTAAKPAAPAPGPARRWQQVRRALLARLLAGEFPPSSPLPDIKQLRAAYGAGYAAVHEGLASLAADGFVERHGRGYRVVPVHAGVRGVSTVVFIGRTRDMDMLTDLAPRSQQLWQALEGRCAHAGLRFVVRSVEDVLDPRGGRPADGMVIGHMVRNLDIDRASSAELIGRLVRGGGPVALVDELGDADRFGAGTDRRRVRVFGIAHSALAGRQLGDHLLRRGCRTVAFVNPYHAAPWALNRAEGVAQAFADAGMVDGVRTHTLGLFEDDFAVRDRALSSAAYRGLARSLGTFRRLANPAVGDGDEFPRDPAFDYVIRHTLEGQLVPLFERILAGAASDAWVGVSDAVALAALRFLRRRRVAVPDGALVAGFDNTFAAMAAGLTSYDFNVDALADALLSHVLRPGRRTGAAATVEIPGMVVARETSRHRLET